MLLDAVVLIFLFIACGSLMSALLLVSVVTESVLRLIQTYTLRPYRYLHFKLGLLRQAP
jgi:hypothetical protein